MHADARRHLRRSVLALALLVAAGACGASDSDDADASATLDAGEDDDGAESEETASESGSDTGHIPWLPAACDGENFTAEDCMAAFAVICEAETEAANCNRSLSADDAPPLEPGTELRCIYVDELRVT